MRLPERSASIGFFAAGLLALVGAGASGLSSACYPAAGEGVDPPALSFYFPVGLAVSRGGNVLYAVNSDFDLQWNGGTIQSLDLHLIRRHTVIAIGDPTNPNLPLALPPDPDASCPSGPPVITAVNDAGVVPGWACAPPTDASFYMRDSAVIGAFATDLQLSVIDDPVNAGHSRIFSPVRGDASLTWAEVADDDPSSPPNATDTPASYAPFQLDCGTRDAHNRCDSLHHTGNNTSQPGDTRLVTMPGEPFGMAQADDGQSIVITHQTDVYSSLFSTFTPGTQGEIPAIQFVLSGVPTGGIGIASVPHDRAAFAPCYPLEDPPSDACNAVFPRPAFLQTSLSVAQVALIRYYSDIGTGPSSLYRPFITDEVNYPLNVPSGTTDFARGIAIDPTPRIRCMAQITVPDTDPTFQAQAMNCAQIPARVFVASRAPPALLIGSVGQMDAQGTYDADLVTFTGSVSLGEQSTGPSTVKLAPIIDSQGNFHMEVFVVCFDSNQVLMYDPDQNPSQAQLIRMPVGLGPFALAFDPFDFDAAARGDAAPAPTVDGDLQLRPYRFMYVGSFTNSYMQVVDLDLGHPDTFGTVVYNVGVPTAPKGS